MINMKVMVTSLLQVSENMENRLRNQYGAPSKSLEKSFELQDFDLVNSERKQHGLNTLKYSSAISNTARKHSVNMSEDHFSIIPINKGTLHLID